MKSTIICLCLLVFFSQSVFSFNSTKYDSNQKLNDVYQIHWRIAQEKESNETKSYIYLALEVTAKGWVGFGIAEQSSGSMPGADIVTATIKNETVSIQDRYSTAFELPIEDTCNDWKLLNSERSNTTIIVELKRLLDTNDIKQDRPIPSGPTQIIAAWSDSKTIGYHGTNRIASAVTFYGQTTTNNNNNNSNITSALLSTKTDIPLLQTSYICTSYKIQDLPIPSYWNNNNNNNTNNTNNNIIDFHIIGFDANINTSNVHHFLVHVCKNSTWSNRYYKNTQECGSPLIDPEADCQTAWAYGPGIANYRYPSNLGFRVSENSGDAFIVNEVHYDNSALKSNLTDFTSIKIYFTNQLRQFDVGFMSVGDPSALGEPIKGGEENIEYEFNCPEECTKKWNENITIISSILHMHQIGSRMWTSHWRNNTNLGNIGRIDYFDFNFQKIENVNVTIMPGDRLNVHCFYDSSTRNNETYFGRGSRDEMCIHFLFYYPALPKYKLCGYAKSNIYGDNNTHTICGNSYLDFINVTNPNKPDPKDINKIIFGTEYSVNYTCKTTNSNTTNNNNTNTTTTTTGEEGTTGEENPGEVSNDIGEVLGAGGVVALLVLGIGISVLLYVYIRKRQREKAERERAAVLAAEMEMGENTTTTTATRSESGVVKLDDSSMYYYSRDE